MRVAFAFVGGSKPEMDTVRLRDVVEARLRREGIAVVENQTKSLLVSCTALNDAVMPVVAYRCDASFYQPVAIRELGLTVSAPTWTTVARVSTIGADKFSSALRETVSAMLDEFLKAWHDANPPK